jgi:hypothetical protein
VKVSRRTPEGYMEPTRYRISVRGQLTQRLAAAFEGMSLEAGNGKTVLAGEIRDQCHLYGVLDQVRNLGLDLVAVEPGAMTVQADSEITGERRVYVFISGGGPAGEHAADPLAGAG